MTDPTLHRLMRSMGLRVFVEYFDHFADFSLTNQEVADLLPHE